MRDPRQQEVKQPFPAQPQAPPGLEQEMRPRPDYGEKSYVGHDRLKGRKALVTGGDSGIGRAVALAFAREGADVAINYLPVAEEADARETVQVIEASGKRCLAIPGDVRESGNCRDIVAGVVREFGGLDIRVNNAAYQMTHASILEMPPEEIDRVFRTNELAERGIRVNAVAPGPVWTPLIPSTMDVEHFGESTPLKRAAQPCEMAPIYVLLASTESSYVTGMVYGATGGQLLP
jgi:hypothetical protein